MHLHLTDPDPASAPCSPRAVGCLAALISATDAATAAIAVGLAVATIYRAALALPVSRRTRAVAEAWAAGSAR